MVPNAAGTFTRGQSIQPVPPRITIRRLALLKISFLVSQQPPPPLKPVGSTHGVSGGLVKIGKQQALNFRDESGPLVNASAGSHPGSQGSLRSHALQEEHQRGLPAPVAPDVRNTSGAVVTKTVADVTVIGPQ